MTADLPTGSGPQEHLTATPLPGHTSRTALPVVVVVSASWAGPSRPAPTVLRELGRRWDGTVQILLVEDPSDELLERWSVDVLPTWLRFLSAAEQADAVGEEQLILPALSGTALDGAEATLPGPWHLVHRRTGAQPKHVIDAEFGPDA